jgi:hypothetical protein
VCCDPAAAQAQFAGLLVDRGLCAERAEADAIAGFVYKHFELVERGTLGSLKKSIARLAKT